MSPIKAGSEQFIYPLHDGLRIVDNQEQRWITTVFRIKMWGDLIKATVRRNQTGIKINYPGTWKGFGKANSDRSDRIARNRKRQTPLQPVSLLQ